MKTEEIANALRLRDTGNWYKLQLEAADALEAQAREIERLREALEPFARFACGDPEGTARPGCACHNCNARRALEDTKGGV